MRLSLKFKFKIISERDDINCHIKRHINRIWFVPIWQFKWVGKIAKLTLINGVSAGTIQKIVDTGDITHGQNGLVGGLYLILFRSKNIQLIKKVVLNICCFLYSIYNGWWCPGTSIKISYLLDNIKKCPSQIHHDEKTLHNRIKPELREN